MTAKNPKSKLDPGRLYYPPFESKAELLKALAEVENRGKPLTDVKKRLSNTYTGVWPDPDFIVNH